MKRLIVFGTMLIVCAAGTLSAKNTNIEKHPGYVNLEDIEIPSNAEDVTDINIGPGLLGMFAGMAEEEDKELGDVIEDFMSIRVKSFEIDSSMTESIRATMDKIEKKLKKEKWQSLVRVKSSDELTNVSIKYDKKNRMQGLMVMTIEDDDEVTFVNLVGHVNLAKLGQLGVDLNGAALDSLKELQKAQPEDDE